MTEKKTIGEAAAWLGSATEEQLRVALPNYRYFVHRFVQWLGYTFAKCDSDALRALILPNLVEECGGDGAGKSHLQLLDDLMRSCGVRPVGADDVLESSKRAESWFFSIFREQDLHSCLSVLGPGVERISNQFLEPFEAAIRSAFRDLAPDLSYFDVHRLEVEDEHAEALEGALRLVENSVDEEERLRLAQRRDSLGAMAVFRHCEFWSGLGESM